MRKLGLIGVVALAFVGDVMADELSELQALNTKLEQSNTYTGGLYTALEAVMYATENTDYAVQQVKADLAASKLEVERLVFVGMALVYTLGFLAGGLTWRIVVLGKNSRELW